MPTTSFDGPRARTGVDPWRVAFAAGLAFYLDAATLISVAIALPVWRDHFDLGTWQVGVISSGLAYAVAIGAVIGGRLADRFDRSRVLTVDLVIFTAGTVLLGLATTPWILLAGVIVVGLAAGADVPTALSVISELAPPGSRGGMVGLTQVLWIAAILMTYALGFVVSRLGHLGSQLLIGHLVVVAVVTLSLRVALAGRLPRRPGPNPRSGDDSRGRLRGSGAGGVLLATGAFYLCWNVAANTLGSYGTYLLVTVTGLTQTQATGLVLITFLPALIMSAIFVRLADTIWRDRLFVVAAVLQVGAFAAGAITGGVALGGIVALVVLYSLSNVFAGEAIYKVWSQLLLPSAVRATGQGLTYALARGAAAGFLVAVPTVLAADPSTLLWVLAGCVTASGLIGLVITRRPVWRSVLRPAQRLTTTVTADE